MFDRNEIDSGGLHAIFVTHGHSDHTLGLMYLLDNKPGNGFQMDKSINLYMPDDVLQDVARELSSEQAISHDNIQQQFYSLQAIQAYQQINVGDLVVQPLETNHLNIHWKPGERKRGCFGYLVKERNGKKLAYMLDAPSEMPERTYQILIEEKIDCLFFDCTFDTIPRPSGHADIQGIVEVHQRVNPKVMIATHISHRNLGHEHLKKVLGEFGIEVAYDGMAIVV
jgi:phosphoribosyl 1,2-cyclic phosphate phosphodiesterase